MADLLGFRPHELFNVVAELEANKNSLGNFRLVPTKTMLFITSKQESYPVTVKSSKGRQIN